MPFFENKIKCLLQTILLIISNSGILSFSVHDQERTTPLLSKDKITSTPQDDTLEEGDLIYKDENDAPRYWHYLTHLGKRRRSILLNPV
jgi:hypothetical protein